jgi:hypothetical protein
MTLSSFSSLVITVIGLSASVIGCAAQPVNANAMQIIVKFKPEVSFPESREMLSDLSAMAKAPVLYKRAMSGGAHVLVIDAAPDVAQAALNAISKRKDVMFAEPDRKMKAE